ncbi:MAG TPA: polymer-forming cytoskeletal protein [Thermoanaerobaculia bacterium]|nr:polymer-forming cytoskeletal protein [Thermoanaerobaculia bacterium]
MSFFRRETEDPPETRPSPRPGPAAPAPETRDRPVTRIAEGTRVDGEVTGATEVLVEGMVQGRIRLDGRAVVGPAGTVRGLISARAVVVAGTVEGDVRGSEKVEVAASAKLLGDIAAPRVTIAEGAFFKGKVEMSQSPPPQQRSEAAPVERPREASMPAALPSTPHPPGQAAPPASLQPPAPAPPPGLFPPQPTAEPASDEGEEHREPGAGGERA